MADNNPTRTVVEGVWNCSYCLRKEIPGFETICPGCGDPQNSVITPGERWFRRPGERVVTDPEELKQANAGPNWNCGGCNESNTADVTVCKHCGNPKSFDDTVNRTVTYKDRGHFDIKPDPRDEMVEWGFPVAKRHLEQGDSPRQLDDLTLPKSELPTSYEDVTDFERDEAAEEKLRHNSTRDSQIPPSIRWFRSNRKHGLIGAAALVAAGMVVALIFGIMFLVQYFTATVPGTVTVTGLRWERSVEVEAYRTLEKSDWDYPSDARVRSTESRVKSYVTVTVGTRYEEYTYNEPHSREVEDTEDCSISVDNGNGSFTDIEQTCDVTRTEYYTIPIPKTSEVPITEEEPVYDDWYTYRIDRWVTDRWANASGNEPKGVYWPKTGSLFQNNQIGDQVGEERIGDDRRAEYSVDYVDSKGESHSELIGDDAIWGKIVIGQAIPANYYQRNGELSSVDWN